jgi:hypothetical protein
MEVACTSEISVPTYNATQTHNSEDYTHKFLHFKLEIYFSFCCFCFRNKCLFQFDKSLHSLNLFHMGKKL